jgi:hypothetical protein
MNLKVELEKPKGDYFVRIREGFRCTTDMFVANFRVRKNKIDN